VARAACRGICVHRTDFFEPEVQTRANVEPGQISNLLGRHPFGLSFYPVVPVPRNGALPCQAARLCRHSRAKPRSRKFGLPRMPGIAATLPASRLALPKTGGGATGR